MKYIRPTLFTFFIITLILYWLFPAVFKLHILQPLRFSIIENTTLYIESNTSQHQRDSLILLDYQAKKLIEEFWNERKSTASTLYCTNLSTYTSLCQNTNSAGCSLITPFGSWVILNGSFGLHEGVMAHELTHTELYERLGWWKMKTDIPTWFDEGLAIQFDSRFSKNNNFAAKYIDFKESLEMYSLGNQNQIPLTELTTFRQFFGNNPSFTSLAYLTSGMEVAKLISHNGPKTFLAKIATIEEGKAFSDVFK